MGCCDRGSSLVSAGPADPSMHVNFAKGMVLGVDDFVQEFTYLSGRDQWAIRELAGYGATSGLKVFIEDDASGPRVHVSAGAAVAPSGKLICVKADQCGSLNAWLAKPENASQVAGRLEPVSPPGSPVDGAGVLPLYLTLCYADCLTALAPIPGEPCRSEEDLMAPSRVADDYRLALALDPPPQTEHDAVADFAAWLAALVVAEPASPVTDDETAWVAALRSAAAPWLALEDASSPPASPPADYMFGSPPTSLHVAPERYGDFLRVALRVWVTELRPAWMARRCGAAAGPLDDCILLARIEAPVIFVGAAPAGVWQVDGPAAKVAVDESRRPILASLALVQALLAPPPVAPPAPPPPAPPNPNPVFNRLTTTGATQIAVTTVAADMTLSASHHCVLCKGQLTITLPKAASATLGRVYVIKSLDKAVTVNRTGSDAIDGQPSYAVAATKAVTVISDGAGAWRVLSALA